LNLTLQSNDKVELAVGSKIVPNSRDLKLLFFGPHARDNCKVRSAACCLLPAAAAAAAAAAADYGSDSCQVWDAVVRRVAQV
jgi:hypothetical protein